MSAFIVSRNHIAALVEALYRYDVPLPEVPKVMQPRTVGQELWNENIESVQHRYHGEPLADLPGPIGEDYEYVHDASTQVRRLVASPVAAYTLAACYSYQACEHPFWPDSLAYRLVQDLQARLRDLTGLSDAQMHASADRTGAPVWAI